MFIYTHLPLFPILLLRFVIEILYLISRKYIYNDLNSIIIGNVE